MFQEVRNKVPISEPPELLTSPTTTQNWATEELRITICNHVFSTGLVSLSHLTDSLSP